jgi:hypothetical protein
MPSSTGKPPTRLIQQDVRPGVKTPFCRPLPAAFTLAPHLQIINHCDCFSLIGGI